MRGIELNDKERIVHSERGSVYSFMIRIVGGGFLFILPFFFFFPLFAFGSAGMTLLLTVSGVGIYVLIRASMKWRESLCIITNHRIIQVKQKGILDKQITYASLKNINDVAYRVSGIGKSMLRIGEVRVTFSGVIPSMLFPNIKRPKVLRDIIVEIKAMPSKASGSSGKQRFKRVHMDV